MHGPDLDKLETLAEGLALAFYLLMFVALVMALAGSAGSGFLLLVAGACAHVGRAAIVEFIDVQRGRDERPSRPQRAPRPVAASPSRERRISLGA